MYVYIYNRPQRVDTDTQSSSQCSRSPHQIRFVQALKRAGVLVSYLHIYMFIHAHTRTRARIRTPSAVLASTCGPSGTSGTTSIT